MGLLLVCAAGPAFADAIVVTRAMRASTVGEFFVTEDSVLVELEIGLADLEVFRDILPDELLVAMGQEPEPLAERTERFLRHGLVIADTSGRPLPGRLKVVMPRARVQRDEVTGEPLPVVDEEVEPVIFVRLGYALRGRPESLSLTPPRSPRAGAPAASIGFVLYHRGLPVNDFRYLGTTEVVDLDWDDPWYSRFRNRNLRRQYDAPLNVFIYVEPYEVRVEIIARPADLQEGLDLGIAGRDTIAAEAQGAMLARIGEFLAADLDLTVDGQPVTPVLNRINFLHRTLRNSTVIDPPVDLPVVSATLGAIFVHPTDGLPEEATVTWKYFGERMDYVAAAATDEAGPLPSRLTPEDNVLRWQNFLTNPTIPTLVEVPPPPRMGVTRVPVAALLFVALAVLLLLRYRRRAEPRPRWLWPVVVSLAAGAVVALPLGRVPVPNPLVRTTDLASVDSPAVVAGLLTNVYRAFDFRDEEAVYDVLSRSASGDLLTQIYLETRRGLELRNQGGARVKVKEVAVEGVEPESLAGRPGLRARCRWQVAGSVGHWGHVHQRSNLYEAELTIEPTDGVWKITDLELIQEERVG